ncbi:fumarylacetoacetate hydrolase family protein [Salidesulfovibrio onnuriiensis]|uniref:fumarylacetoacetate hydrolase family protein n=1 Tax=Salidesulfovibrio onnuriiensis TaxID=2583823 RepID=UPI0011CB9EE5|nr:fumarylacetoacetate hydrolase family protein [Salidesulfovibrio onnuriiensis]
MKIVRFQYAGEVRYGVHEDDSVRLAEGTPFSGWKLVDERVAPGEVRLLAPCEPSKVVCIGLNYVDHAAELNMALPDEPLMFLKPPTAVCGPGDTIVYPAMTGNLHYEAELGIVIGGRAKDIPEDEALGCVLGYTCANDVTARDLQARDGQWTRCKSFDTFMPLGPCIETVFEPDNAAIRLTLNGEERQSSNISNFIFKVPRLVSFVSQVMTLLPGDVIITGTPPGIGPMERGDSVRVEIEGIGALENPVG